MSNTHTIAKGTEPFDKMYSLGYQVNHEDWSPFPRVNHLRQTFWIALMMWMWKDCA